MGGMNYPVPSPKKPSLVLRLSPLWLTWDPRLPPPHHNPAAARRHTLPRTPLKRHTKHRWVSHHDGEMAPWSLFCHEVEDLKERQKTWHINMPFWEDPYEYRRKINTPDCGVMTYSSNTQRHREDSRGGGKSIQNILSVLTCRISFAQRPSFRERCPEGLIHQGRPDHPDTRETGGRRS